MTEKEEQIVKSIWGSSVPKCSKSYGIEHEHRCCNLNKSIKDSGDMQTVKTKKRVS